MKQIACILKTANETSMRHDQTNISHRFGHNQQVGQFVGLHATHSHEWNTKLVGVPFITEATEGKATYAHGHAHAIRFPGVVLELGGLTDPRNGRRMGVAKWSEKDIHVPSAQTTSYH